MTEFEKELLTKIGHAVLRVMDPFRDADQYRDLQGQLVLLGMVTCGGEKAPDTKSAPVGQDVRRSQPEHGAYYARTDAVER